MKKLIILSLILISLGVNSQSIIDATEITEIDSILLYNSNRTRGFTKYSAFVEKLKYDIEEPPQLKAFPNAYGGGAEARGGRDGILYIVNDTLWDAPAVYHPASGNNDEYYTGGLHEAFESDSFNNTDIGHVVFNVSGNIHLPVGGYQKSNIKQKTVYGQSAPMGGITITGGTFRFSDGGDVQPTYPPSQLVFRYLRSRPIRAIDGQYPDTALSYDYGGSTLGDDLYTWAFRFDGGEYIIVDHCSASFAYDKNMGGGVRSWFDTMYAWTFSNNLSADGLTSMYFEINTGHEQIEPFPQNKPNNISAINNVFTTANRTPNIAFGGYGEVINNVIHAIPYKYSTTYWNLRLNLIANYYSGEGSGVARNRISSNGSTTEPNSKPTIYTDGNYLIKADGTVIVDGISGNDRLLWTNYIDGADPLVYGGANFGEFNTGSRNSNNIKFPYQETTVFNAFERLITNGDVGAYKYLDDNGDVQIYRDSFDTGQLTYVANNDDSYSRRDPANWVLPVIPKNTRPAGYDTDNDGMCDAWEIRTFGDLSQSYRGDYFGLGYNNIEYYMNQVDN